MATTIQKTKFSRGIDLVNQDIDRVDVVTGKESTNTVTIDGDLLVLGDLNTTTETNLNPQANNTQTIGSDGLRWGGIYGANVYATNLHVTGVYTDLIPNSTNEDLGSAGSRWGSVYSQHLNATANLSITGDIVISNNQPSLYLKETNVTDLNYKITDDGGEFKIQRVDDSLTNPVTLLKSQTDGTIEISHDLIVSGNLSIQGNSVVLDVQTLDIEDAILTLNKNFSGTPGDDLDAGLNINRGSADDVSIIWDESEDHWTLTGDYAIVNVTGGTSTDYVLKVTNSNPISGHGDAVIVNGNLVMADASSIYFQRDGSDAAIAWSNADGYFTITDADSTSRIVTEEVHNYYALAAADGDDENSEKIQLSASGTDSGTDTITISVSDDLDIARDGNKITISHETSGVTADTYGQSGDEDGEYIKSITVDARGHITAISANNFDDRYDNYNKWVVSTDSNGSHDREITSAATFTISGGTDLETSMTADDTVTINHSSVTSTSSTGTATTVADSGSFTAITGVTVSGQGHVTDVESTTFTLTDDINTTYTLIANTSSGTNADPFIKLVGSDDNNDQIQLVGSGIATVTRNEEDQITITATEADTLDSVTDRGNTTENNITTGNHTIVNNDPILIIKDGNNNALGGIIRAQDASNFRVGEIRFDSSEANNRAERRIRMFVGTGETASTATNQKIKLLSNNTSTFIYDDLHVSKGSGSKILIENTSNDGTLNVITDGESPQLYFYTGDETGGTNGISGITSRILSRVKNTDGANVDVSEIKTRVDYMHATKEGYQPTSHLIFKTVKQGENAERLKYDGNNARWYSEEKWLIDNQVFLGTDGNQLQVETTTVDINGGKTNTDLRVFAQDLNTPMIMADASENIIRMFTDAVDNDYKLSIGGHTKILQPGLETDTKLYLYNLNDGYRNTIDMLADGTRDNGDILSEIVTHSNVNGVNKLFTGIYSKAAVVEGRTGNDYVSALELRAHAGSTEAGLDDNHVFFRIGGGPSNAFKESVTNGNLVIQDAKQLKLIAKSAAGGSGTGVYDRGNDIGGVHFYQYDAKTINTETNLEEAFAIKPYYQDSDDYELTFWAKNFDDNATLVNRKFTGNLIKVLSLGYDRIVAHQTITGRITNADNADAVDWSGVGNKPDPTLTLTGDATGSATFTNVGDATLTVEVVNDSHTHDTRYYTETESDGRYIYKAGDTNIAGSLVPNTNDAYDLGSSTKAWRNIYTNDLNLSNLDKEHGNDVDGTTGSWTIQEGKENLYLINRTNGKKYKFKLEEVD